MRLVVKDGPEGMPAGAIGAALEASSTKLSFHLSHLERAGLVQSRREARSITTAQPIQLLYLFVIPRRMSAEIAPSRDVPAAQTSNFAKPSLLLPVTLALTLTLAAALSSLMSVHLPTILQASGVALASAVGLGALVGPSQVAARTIEMAIARYHHPIWTKIVAVSFVAMGVSALWSGLPLIPVALACYGGGIGLESIARGTLPLALFGASGYATLMGRLAMPSLLAQAAAPWIGALLLERVGPHATLGVLGLLAIVNIGLAGALAWMVSRYRLRASAPA